MQKGMEQASPIPLAVGNTSIGWFVYKSFSLYNLLKTPLLQDARITV